MTHVITAMPEYESYQNHEVGELPIAWKMRRFRDVFDFSKGLNITKENLEDVGVPCVSYGEIHSRLPFKLAPSRHEIKCVNKYYLKHNNKSLLNIGDIVFADTSEDIEGSGNFLQLVEDATIFAGYHTIIARPNDEYEDRFLAYLLDSRCYREQIRRAVKGVKVYSITIKILKNTTLWLPSKAEQVAIAKYLDEKTTQIDEATGIKEQQIALLNELKKIIIQNVVTKGLNPNVNFKDSGFDWIGEIPAHWEVTSLGPLLKPISQKGRPDLPLLSITREQGVIVRDVKNLGSNHNFIPDDLSGYKVINKGHFGMNKMKAWQGSYGVSDFSGIVSPAYYIFDFNKPIIPEYFHWAIRSRLYVSYFASASDGVRIGQWDLSKTRMKSIPFLVPSEEEQEAIAKFLDEKTTQIDEVTRIKKQEIDKLNEYKASLINSAVTGKVKVI
ncbi:MAG: restriction endonuclease subunit S [Proteobacteria bacterium]|nr:restriction endonuclease subunit S [Pseudomonadota bacterium]